MGSGLLIWAITATFVAILAITRLAQHGARRRRELHGSKAQEQAHHHDDTHKSRGRGRS
jgi:uncharacterized protein YciW